MKTLLSVLLCTHNPRADYLRRVLDSLRTQTIAPEKWELVVVDNASTNRLSDHWDFSWHPRARHVREEELGIAQARLRGIAEARGELLVFVDDDNVPGSDFLEHAATIHDSYPHIGVFGSGTLEPEFEIPPPPELCSRLSLLALRTVSAPVWSNNPKDYGCVPWSAGMVLTRRVGIVYRELMARVRLTDIVGRRGQQLCAGEDDLLSWAAVATGLGFGIFPQLRVTHLIAARRLTRRYFLRLIHDTAYSNGIMSYVLADEQLRRLDAFRAVQVLLHAARNGYFSMRCQLAAATGEAAAARYVAANRLEPFRIDGCWINEIAV
jgi:glycosyltransferase involved in cell wall biosynthesis